MANNDKLKQIVSNLQILTDLTNSMIGSEMYPVSFFSQAFDLIQKIQSDIQTLEVDQVEMFAAQMKKHQTLILSIHQQMRNISPDTPEQRSVAPINAAKPATPDHTPKPEAGKRVMAPGPEVSEQGKAAPKKASFLTRLGIHKDEKGEEKANPDNTVKQTSPIIEEPIRVPEKKTVPVHKPMAEPVAEKKPVVEKPVAPSTTTAPPVKKVIQPAMPATETPSHRTEHSAEVKKTKAMPAEVRPAPVEANATPLLKDVIEKKQLSDLRKAFSLNDRFLYRRELFGGSEEAMNKAITILNNKESFKESVDFLEEKLHWNFSDPTVKNFVKVLEIRFL